VGEQYFAHVKRRHNKAADDLANSAMDKNESFRDWCEKGLRALLSYLVNNADIWLDLSPRFSIVFSYGFICSQVRSIDVHLYSALAQRGSPQR